MLHDDLECEASLEVMIQLLLFLLSLKCLLISFFPNCIHITPNQNLWHTLPPKNSFKGPVCRFSGFKQCGCRLQPTHHSSSPPRLNWWCSNTTLMKSPFLHSYHWGSLIIIHYDNIRGVSSSWRGNINVSSNTYSNGKICHWEVLHMFKKKKKKKGEKPFVTSLGNCIKNEHSLQFVLSLTNSGNMSPYYQNTS